MLIGQLARANKDELEFIKSKLEENEESINYLTQLIWEVSQIPYTCGNQDCHSHGCLAIRDAQNTVRELIKNIWRDT